MDRRPGAIESQPDDTLGISATTGVNLDRLLDKIAGFAASATFGGHAGLITRERHRAAFASAREALGRILDDPSAPVELIAEELRAARFALERLTGAVDVEDILSDIFARFCIGK
jgi:tRNA modification GTPase